MWIGHRKEIRKLTFRALALRRSESNSCFFSLIYTQKEQSTHIYCSLGKWRVQTRRPIFQQAPYKKANSLYETYLQGITMVLYSSSWCFDEYNYHDSLQANLIERIGHSFELTTCQWTDGE